MAEEKASTTTDGLSAARADLHAQVFSTVTAADFPMTAHGKIINIGSDKTVAQAVEILAEKNILCAPVDDVTKPEGTPTSEKFIGLVDMVGIVIYLLENLEGVLDTVADESKRSHGLLSRIAAKQSFASAKVDKFLSTPLSEATGTYRFTPFVSVSQSAPLSEVLDVLGKQRVHRLCVVDESGWITNIITQSAVVALLNSNLPRLDNIASKSISELGMGQQGEVFTVADNKPVLEAFKLIKNKHVSAVPVVSSTAGGGLLGNISARDLRIMVSHPELFSKRNFSVRNYLSAVHQARVDSSALFIGVKASDSLSHVIQSLMASKIHRIYVVEGNVPVGVISLSDVIGAFYDDSTSE